MTTLITPEQFVNVPLKISRKYRQQLWDSYPPPNQKKPVMLKYVKEMTDEEKKFQARIYYNLRLYLNRSLQQYQKGLIVRERVKFQQLVGCTIPELRTHLEQQFVTGMSWETYGRMSGKNPMTWFILHIIPHQFFDFTDPVEIKQYMHYTNLRPFFWKDYNDFEKSIYRHFVNEE